MAARTLSSDANFMRLALAEALKTDPFPNPRVGAVLVKGGKILATGHHEYAGGPHAEIDAIRDAKKLGKSAAARIRGSTLYVTLEPCSHLGKKTPPCTDAILRAGISRVMVGTKDSNPSVNGKGIVLLRKNRVDVVDGILAGKCAKLNERISTSLRKKLPLVAARFAMSLDGKIATYSGDSKWVSGPRARDFARRLRGSYDVLLVGANTVMNDNPLLTCRTPGMPEPLRVICDSKLRVHPKMRVFSVLKEKVLIATSAACDKKRKRELEAAGIGVLVCGKSRVNLELLLRTLFELGKRSVLIEGGGGLIGTAFDLRLVQRIYAFIAPKVIGGERAISPVRGCGVEFVRNAAGLKFTQTRFIGSDLFVMADVLD